MRKIVLVPMMAAGVLLASGCSEELLTPGPSEAAAQEAPAAEQGERMRGPRFGLRAGRGMPPLARLLEQREALGLTADQVARLEALQAQLRSEGEALRARLRAERPDRADRPDRAGREARARLSEEERTALREQMRERREALRPLRQEARTTRRAALTELREILSDEQEAKLREMRRAR